MGGRQPIAGAKIYMYAADTSQSTYGHASKSLFVNYTAGSFPTSADGNGNYFLTSNSAGNFTVAAGEYACTTGQQVYLLAVGGDPGGGVNSAVSLMAALGTCDASSGFATVKTGVVINEVSTAAAAYALAGFMTSPTAVASTNTASSKQGLANAFATAANLYDVNTGTAGALAQTPNGNGTVPQALVNTLGDVLAACVNSGGATSSQCSMLFSNAQSAGSSGTTPTDTATAMMNIAHHPANATSSLFSVKSSTPPFLPALAVAPGDFTLAVKYSGLLAPNDVGIDSAGGIWVTGTNVAYKFSNLGVPASGSPFPLTSARFLSVSTGDAVYITLANGGVAELTATGSNVAGSPFLVSTLAGTQGIEATGGVVNVVSTTANTLYQLTYAGVVSGTYLGTSCTGTNPLMFVALDSSNNTWADSPGGSAACRISGTTGLASAISGLNTPQRMAVDGSANAWFANGGNSTLAKVSPAGAVSTYSSGGLSSPYGVAVDGSGAVWVTNTGSSSLSEFSGGGTALSPSSGWTAGGSLTAPRNLAIDSSGNVWVTSSSTGILTEVVGAATPVLTPLASAVATGKLGATP